MTDKPTYHAVITLDGGPGGLIVDVAFAEKLPFEVETIILAGVEEERLADYLDDDDGYDGVVVNEYGNDDPDGWLWEGDSIGGIHDDSAFARTVFKRPNQFRKEGEG